MAFGRSKPASSESSPGLKQKLISFLKEASFYAQLRGELLGIEAKEAAGIYGKKISLIVAGGISLLLGYLLLIAGLIGLIGSALAGEPVSLENWTGAALVLATIHVTVGVILIRKGRKTGANSELFEYSRSELKKDQEWLNHKKKP